MRRARFCGGGGMDGNEEIAKEAARTQSEFDLLMARWKAEYEASNVGNRHDILFNILCQRAYWRTISYMRRYPQRLLSSNQTYSDRCVGGEELQALATFGKSLKAGDNVCSAWLEKHKIPSAEVAKWMLLMLTAQLGYILNTDLDDPILRLARGFGLSSVEFEVLSTLTAVMSNEDLLKLMTVAWADFSVRLPTVSFLVQLLAERLEDRNDVFQTFREDGILRQMQLISVGEHDGFAGKTPLLYMTANAEQAVIDAFWQNKCHGSFSPHISVVTRALPLKRLLGASQPIEKISHALEDSPQNVCLCGVAHSGRRTVLASVAQSKSGMRLLEFDFGHVLETKDGKEIEYHLACAMRESVLGRCILAIRLDKLEEGGAIYHKLSEHAAAIERLCIAYPARIFIFASKYCQVIDDAFAKPEMIEFSAPDPEHSREVWLKALSGCGKAEREKMATVFSRNYALPVGIIFSVARDAADLARKENGNDGATVRSHHVLNEIRKSFRHQLGSLAEITVSDVALSGVVLTDEAKEQVDEILEYASQLHRVLDTWGFRRRSPYGNALSALFAGPPGTGKTLLACALANELGKVLYRVDLSRIVDKYIGETEKNLGRIFDEAAKAQAIILFDEADSLFAKRTEVKSSNDRYANLEINFLLQKLESYEGITILTTNLSKSIDDAFRRRIRFIVDFPMPDAAAREKLWKRLMPPGAPLADDIRWHWLARTFEMSGGYIRNAVLKASISASAHNRPIDTECLARAAEAQARSMGQLIRISDDYGEYGEYGDDDN